ncbi:MAG TPA: hypothetical protein PK760_04230, partial [Flavobacteriales bacterium]|nr:hypothetical protein [Flavobacteriales bacterium]
GYDFRAMNDGYYEAGLQVDNLLRSGFTGFGVAVFYRMGPSMLPAFEDNIAAKVTLGFAFGN